MKIMAMRDQSSSTGGVLLDVRGEIVCLLGGNASGKSTVMKVILGLHRPRAGAVSFCAQTIARGARRL